MMTPRDSEMFDVGWTHGYTQGQYNLRRTILRKLAGGDVASLRAWLAAWPKKRRKRVKP